MSQDFLSLNMNDEANSKNGDNKPERMYYKRVSKHYLADEPKKEDKHAVLTAAAYHKQTKILVVGK